MPAVVGCAVCRAHAGQIADAGCGPHKRAYRATARAGLWAVSQLILLAAGVAHGDGGLMRLSQTAGPFEITLFTAPTPLRVGRADISVMVLAGDDRSPVLDAAVEVALRAADTAGPELTATATHAAATNKLLYAASLEVPGAGRWTLTARVRAGARSAAVACELDVVPPQAPLLAFWGYLALPAVVVALFALHQWLKLHQRTGR